MKTKRILSLFLTLVMICGLLPMNIFKAEAATSVSFLFGTNTFLEKLVYILVGLSGVLSLAIFPSINNIRD